MALLLELVESPVMIAPPTSLSVGAIGQQELPGDYQSPSAAPTTYLFSSKLIIRSITSLLSQELLDGNETAWTGPALRTKSSRK